MGHFLFFCNQGKLGIDVKGTSSALRAALLLLLGNLSLSSGVDYLLIVIG